MLGVTRISTTGSGRDMVVLGLPGYPGPWEYFDG
jgi:hypothetical protein